MTKHAFLTGYTGGEAGDMNIRWIAEDDTVIGFFAHGHQAPEAFAAAVLAEMAATIQPDNVRHVWLRQIPDGPEGMHIREYAQSDGRGSFAATVVDWGY